MVGINNKGLTSDIASHRKKKSKDAVDTQSLVKKTEIKASTATDGGFTGKGGEYLVCAELLFRGFNASIMSVDRGIDIIAIKNKRLFRIQVKTANLNKSKAFGFDIGKTSFERHDAGDIFYVFVLRCADKTDFLILPFYEMEKKVYEKAIFLVGQTPRLRVNIRLREDGTFLGSKGNQMDYYLNNWNVIK